LAAALTQDPLFVNYLGHGSQDLWAGGLLSTDTLAKQGGGGSGAFYSTVTCLNGFFQDVARPSLAEALLARTSGGAFGVWASSGFTEVRDQAAMARAFAGNLTIRAMTAGEAARAAKAETTSQDVRRTWILFGDPTWQMFRQPEVALGTDGGADADGATKGMSWPDASPFDPIVPGAGDASAPAGPGVPVAVASGEDSCACDLGGAQQRQGGGPALALAAVAAYLARRRSRPRR
jgi:hypothetical protein